MERLGGQVVDLFLCLLLQLRPMLTEIITEYMLCSRLVILSKVLLLIYNVKRF